MAKHFNIEDAAKERQAKELYEKIAAENIIAVCVDSTRIPLEVADIRVIGGSVLGKSPLDGGYIAIPLGTILRFSVTPALRPDLVVLLEMIAADRKESK